MKNILIFLLFTNVFIIYAMQELPYEILDEVDGSENFLDIKLVYAEHIFRNIVQSVELFEVNEKHLQKLLALNELQRKNRELSCWFVSETLYCSKKLNNKFFRYVDEQCDKFEKILQKNLFKHSHNREKKLLQLKEKTNKTLEQFLSLLGQVKSWSYLSDQNFWFNLRYMICNNQEGSGEVL